MAGYGSGRGGHNPPSWNAGKTTVIRVPEAKKNFLLSLARTLDELDWDVEFIPKDSYNKAIEILTKQKSKARGHSKEVIEETLSLLEK